MLVFRNPGLIHLVALTTAGISVKETASPIGQFGTGVKYAIAVILRHGGKVAVWRGRKLYTFGIAEKIVRGEKFRIVTMNGRELGYTDQLGKHWLPWMAYRELWSNMRDEGGRVHRVEDDAALDIGPKETAFVVECAELDRAHKERHRIILQTEPLVVVPGLEIHAGSSEYVYYRGIRVAGVPGSTHSKPARSLYTYNLTGTQTLTEDRTLAYTWSLPNTIARSLVQLTNLSVLHELLSQEHVKGFMEDGLPFADVKDQKPSPQFMEVAEQLSAAKKLGIAVGAVFREYQDTLPGYRSPYLVDLTDTDEYTVGKALEIVGRLGIPVSRAQLRFKSVLKYGQVQANARDGMTIDYSVVRLGADELAAVIVEGAAQMAGGNTTQQLARWIVTREFKVTREQGIPDRVGEIAF